MKTINRFIGQSVVGLGASSVRRLGESCSREVAVLREKEEGSQLCENLGKKRSRLRDQPVQRPWGRTNAACLIAQPRPYGWALESISQWLPSPSADPPNQRNRWVATVSALPDFRSRGSWLQSQLLF